MSGRGHDLFHATLPAGMSTRKSASSVAFTKLYVKSSGATVTLYSMLATTHEALYPGTTGVAHDTFTMPVCHGCCPFMLFTSTLVGGGRFTTGCAAAPPHRRANTLTASTVTVTADCGAMVEERRVGEG